MSRTRVLGVGSPAGDDQAGWLAVDALQGSGLDACKLDRPGAALVSLLEDVDHVILIDAMQGGGVPGRIRHFDKADWCAYGAGLSSHGFGVLDSLALAQALDCLPERLDLYGIEIASACPGDGPGAEVRTAAALLAARIAASLGKAA